MVPSGRTPMGVITLSLYKWKEKDLDFVLSYSEKWQITSLVYSHTNAVEQNVQCGIATCLF